MTESPADWGKWLWLGTGAGLEGIASGVLRSLGVAQVSTDKYAFDVPAAAIGIGAAYVHGRKELAGREWARQLLAGLAIGSIGSLAKDVIEGVIPVSPEQRVWLWFKTMLQRPPDAEGFKYWVERLKKEPQNERTIKADFMWGAYKEITGGAIEGGGAAAPAAGAGAGAEATPEARAQSYIQSVMASWGGRPPQIIR